MEVICSCTLKMGNITIHVDNCPLIYATEIVVTPVVYHAADNDDLAFDEDKGE
jgi:hypothetical protein